MVLELRESTDHLVRAAETQVRTGRRWKAQEEVYLAIGRLMHREVVGRDQEGQAGLRWCEPPFQGQIRSASTSKQCPRAIGG